ncbi:AsmA-like C-terminal region-containing protein [Flavitalea sp. BT771]|uniref:AsmA family protein n=1 Tax=Flavitalea sp. BT771 TaxID=3063329 RepID=UPI0026E45C9A|nr:AsmA-like C-terminal region-containing protein [Flavitalea sp. BT771]MDO6431114.1 AsmA-like C-terminal region-containing protein [Flavitalea sp. BT771]MDV6220021.1 AsmA-like C-terminal region-containing protein [Flavitalea sp. BT771]
MSVKIRRVLLRFILLPIVILLVLVITAVAILYSQQQRLVGIAVKELNKQLPGRLVVDGSEITAFQNFPYISIGLKNVKFYPGKLASDKPIYEAERMFAGFSLSDILKQQYHVKVIALKNGHLDLVQDTAGKLNIVEASRMTKDTTRVANTSAPAALDLAIKKIVLKNIIISYLDKRSGQQIATHIDKIRSSLQDDSMKVIAELQGGMMVDYTRPGDTALFRHNHLETNVQLTYEKPGQVLRLGVCNLKLEDALFNITGSADFLHDNLVDIRVTGDKPDFAQLFSFAPPEVVKELKHFRYDGHLAFDGKIKGKLKGGQQPLIELSFSCRNAWLNNTHANKKLDSLGFKGYYTNGAGRSLKTSELRLLDMTARPGEGIFKGNFVLRDFSDPKISMRVNAELELGFIGAFLGIKDLQRLTGHISLKMDFKELVDLSLPEQSVDKLTQGIQSELTVRNLTFRVPSYPFNIEHVNAHAAMKDGFLNLDSLIFKVGNSDFHMDGWISDLPAIFHRQQKPVQVAFNAHSNKIILRELLNADTNQNKKAREEIYGFNISLALETSVNELLHPKPLPRGKFSVQNLNAAFKRYPHVFHDFGAELTIEDTTLRLKNFAGKIDSSDIRFSGRVNNYALWFNKVMKGRTQVAFDLKSQHLAMHDLLGRKSRQYVPKDYHDEVASNLWLRSKIDLKYDSVFRFANIRIANISGELKNHAFRLDSVNGNVKIGTDNFIKIDTLKGKVGNSDFDISMRLYTGKDTMRMKKENYLQFSARMLDVDQLMSYRLTAEEPAPDLSEMPAANVVAKTSVHASAFNVFQIPFINFNASANIGKIKYRRLWIKNFFTNIRMQTNQQLYLDTLGMDIAEGKINARAHFNGSNADKIYLRSKIKVQDVNIEKMMLKLDYLGQDYVINKNIKGHLSGDIKTYIQVHPDLTPLMDHCQAEMDVAITDGMLVNFTPIKAMSSYFSDKNLNMVRFDTLRDKLTFKDGALTIPSMNINSSLGFMEISGTQSLDTHMEYYVRIPLKMVTQVGFRMLFGRKREEVDPDQVDAIEYRDKDKRVRFMNLKISGTPDDYKVGLGKAKKA